MAVRFLSSVLPGAPVSMALSGQSSVNVPSWGVSGGGTITINVDRTTLQCAPDSVRFSVDLSAATFDTPAPTGGEVYDARMHDLIYLWDLGDTGDWSAPVNVLANWKNRSVAKGPFVGHMYRNPKPAALGAGNGYAVSVLVVEPSSGKFSTAAVEVFVEDPDVVYADADTIHINPAGDSDFSDVPAGVPAANRINMDHLAVTNSDWIARIRLGNAKRVRLKRGASYTANVRMSWEETEGMLFDAYGSDPSKPIINGAGGTNGLDACFYWNGNHANGSHEDLRFSQLDFRGTFDPVTMRSDSDIAGVTGGAISGLGPISLMISECDFSGFQRTTVRADPAGPGECHTHMDDCTLTDFGGQYPIYYYKSDTPNSVGLITGCRFAQNPNAIDNIAGVGSSRAIFRADHLAKFHARGCDWFHTDSYQHHLKTPETPEADGLTVNIHSCSFEGGFGAIVNAGNAGSPSGLSRSSVHNIVLDGLIYVGNHSSEQPFRSFATGLTVRNSMVIAPAIPTYSTNANAFIVIQAEDTFDATIVGAAPIKIYNNTFRVDRTSAQNNGHTPIWVNDTYASGLFTNVQTDNNVIHMPNLDTPQTAFAPLSDTVLWTPRGLGRRDGTTFVLDSSYALPADAVKATKPLPGSAALGAATTGSIAHQDIDRTERATPANKGAWAGTA